jgi:hypothetical protein
MKKSEFKCIIKECVIEVLSEEKTTATAEDHKIVIMGIQKILKKIDLEQKKADDDMKEYWDEARKDWTKALQLTKAKKYDKASDFIDRMDSSVRGMPYDWGWRIFTNKLQKGAFERVYNYVDMITW